MPEKPADVVISGGGPNGLMLAGELGLAGMRPIVLEKLPQPSDEPRANGIVGQVVRLLDIRGLYHEFGGPPGPPRPAPAFYFGGMPVSFATLDTNPVHTLLISQPKLVRQLEKRARGLSVDIRWGHELTGLTQHDDHVVVTVAGPEGPYEITTNFLVGADGGKSLVRKETGIAFPGTTTTRAVTRIAHVSLPEKLRTEDGGLDVPGAGRLQFGFNRVERGVFTYAELEPGRPMIATTEYGGEPADEDIPLTLQELRDSVRRVLGADLPIDPPRGPGPHALRRLDGQNTRQAERYREGTVFLVGDAAHVHSAMGGPGLNLGLQDAANLGWKLAAHLNGWAPPGLLDTYHTERHPVGQRVMMHTLAQGALMAPGAEVTALRQLFGELVGLPDNVAHIAHLLAGSDVRYDTGDTHPLSGRMVPDLTIHTSHGRQRTAELLHQGRPVLLDLTDSANLTEITHGWADRVDTVPAACSDAPADALLIRPDGYVTWATNSLQHTEPAQLEQALTRWFGPAH
ncbi:FAD-dependent monooxygenase [Amycolatopsis anabasis]|uniref:FAD-dependent monooxygenase n=1 Tax=Amycolatopsis anabasis TaxID=1840409 RepID=UPI00131D4B90|nr:FAD-dependent monooxygenase [Amycolatopsis anabasis]